MGMDEYLRFAFALIFVVALIGLLAVLSRRMGIGFPVGTSKLAKDRRVQVVEVAPLDARRKLVLIRRDDVEHLIVVSPNSEIVVERGIRKAPDFKDVLSNANPDTPVPGEDTSGSSK